MPAHSVVLPDFPYVTIPAAAGLTADEALPWLIDVDVFETAVSQTNWDTVTAIGILMGSYKISSGVQNDEISWDLVLAKGTWTVELLYRLAADQGIYSVQFGGVEKGTIDAFSGSPSYNNRASVTGIAVATTAKVRLTLKMATKNASASAYYGLLQHVQLRRTA